MRIFVHARPNAFEACVEKIDETHFVVAVTEPPVRGQANLAIIKAVAAYFHTPAFRVRIVSGYTSRQKIVDVQL